jgi:ankyrin repeat protein
MGTHEKKRKVVMSLDDQLINACKAGDLKGVEKLVEAGATIEGETCYPMTPLTISCACGHAQIVEYLLRNGAHVDAPDKWHGGDGSGGHRTPLMFAVTGGHIDIAQTLLEWGANIMASDAGLGAAVVFWAVRSGKVEMLEFLASRGASLSTTDRRGQTLLFWAVAIQPAASRSRVIYFLLEKGADPNWRSSNGNTVLFGAANSHDTELVKDLIRQGCDVNAVNNWGWTPLFWAALTENNLEVLETLLKSGANVNHKAKDGTTSLFWAKEEGCDEAAALLIKYGADPTVIGTTKMMRASCARHPLAEGITKMRRRHGA